MSLRYWPTCVLCERLGVSDPRYVPGDSHDEGCPWHDDAIEPMPVGRAKPRRLSMEEKVASGAYTLCACRRDLMRKGSAMCHQCRRDTRLGNRCGKLCTCGGPKGKNAAACWLCTYPDSERAQLARLRRSAA